MLAQNIIQTDIQTILELIYEHRNYLGPAEENATNSLHRAQISYFVDREEPIHMVLPAFPAKSPNPKKTVGVLPDLGELLALTRLNDLCQKISAVYEPGASITLCSDGRVFSDLVLVDDQNVSVYSQKIDQIIHDRNLHHLNTYDLDDVFPAGNFNHRRDILMNLYGPKQFDSTLFNGIHRFIFEDRVVLFPELSRNKVREQSKSVAKEVIQRSGAWGNLVEAIFPHSLRLSIHPQPADSKKIGIRLLEGNDPWGTPWHNVVIRENGKFVLTPRHQAEAKGATLKFFEDEFAYFELGD